MPDVMNNNWMFFGLLGVDCLTLYFTFQDNDLELDLQEGKL